MENETVETPQIETPVVETPVVETPAETPAVIETPVIVPDGYVAKSELDVLTARIAEIETERETARADARNAQINAHATALGFNDASDAARFVGSDVSDIEAALKAVAESKPYLIKSQAAPVVTPTSPTNPPRTNALTMEAIKGMTPAQIAAQWSDVKAVLAQG